MKALFSPASILVVCEGNLCRSPMAEGLLKASLGPSVRVESAGLAVREGLAPHPEAVRLMDALGIDIRACRSRPFTPELALANDLVLVMDARQKQWGASMVPSAWGRIHLIGRWLPPGRQEVLDPINLGPAAFRDALDRLQEGVAGWLKVLVRP